MPADAPQDAGAARGIQRGRRRVAVAVGLAGVVLYNWWIVVPFVPGLMPSTNGFFSDLEANGMPDAVWMQRADMVAGLLLVSALVLRGPVGRTSRRREWLLLVVFAVAGAVGGRFPYACAEGLSPACRQLEWSLQLPVHHYVHVLSGIVEFATLTTAAVLAARRTLGERSVAARVHRTLVRTLVLAYPLLGFAYLTDRFGAFVEPIFFVTFSAMLVTELLEPARAWDLEPATEPDPGYRSEQQGWTAAGP